MVEDFIEKYRIIHKNNPKSMTGAIVAKRKIGRSIVLFLRTFRPERTLDYGCGKGLQWTEHKLHEEAGVEMPTLYDPAVEGIDDRPFGEFDCTICTDVMEHIPEEKMRETLEDIYAYTEKAVLLQIACNPAKKSFADGTNFHVNCKPEDWWFRTIKETKPPHLYVWLYFHSFNGVIKYDPE